MLRRAPEGPASGVSARRPRAGSRRGGSAARPASGRRSTRRARSPRARPAPPRAAPARARVVDLRRRDGVVDERDRAGRRQHLEEPGPVANSSTSAPPPGWTRVEPAFSVAISGACRASTPISPICAGNDHHLGLALERRPVGRDERDVELLAGAAATSALRRGERLAALDRALDRADHVEGLLGQVVVLALDDLR